MEGTVCGRCGSPASIAFAPDTLGPLAAQALLSGYWWIRPGGSALAWASIAAAAVATRAGILLLPVLPPPPPVPLLLVPLLSRLLRGPLPGLGRLGGRWGPGRGSGRGRGR